jgi:hypothetical protein
MLQTVPVVIAVLFAAQPAPDDQLPDGYQLKILHHAGGPSNEAGGGVLGRQTVGGVLGIDTIQSFSSSFYYPGLVPSSFGPYAQWTWQYTMVGQAPFGAGSSSHSTTIDAPIVAVNIDLRNYDGSPRYYIFPDGTQGPRMVLDATQFVQPVLKSPVFQDARYSSSARPTQLTDAVHRAQFFNLADDSWHTRLQPSVKAARTMVLIRGTYRYAVDATGHLVYVLVDEGAFNSLLFPATPDDTTTVIGSAENSGDITTQSISTFLFPNTYLYQGGDPANCCVLGYHSYDVEPGSRANGWKERHYVMNYSSWISPGIFGGGFSDVTALSHELSETFSDPFVNNATPIWVAPNGLCQNNLESGDVIEGLPNAVFPMTMNGYTYHPQNEALLQWFAGVDPSNAFHHAYSYPDTSVLTAPAISYQPDCTTPAVIPTARQ